MQRAGHRSATAQCQAFLTVVFCVLAPSAAWIWSHPGLQIASKTSQRSSNWNQDFCFKESRAGSCSAAFPSRIVCFLFPFAAPSHRYPGSHKNAALYPVIQGQLGTRRRPQLHLLPNGGSGGGGRGFNGNNGWGWNDGDRRKDPAAAVVVSQWPPGATDEDTAASSPGMEKDFSTDQIPDVWGAKPVRRAVITGANTGIGLEMSIQLAKKGWHVVMACRNKQRGEAALAKVREVVGERVRVELMELDAGDPESVREFVRQYKLTSRPLHLLINNAGVMLNDFRISPWGVEQTFAVNYLGPYLLTTMLLPPLRKATSKGFPSRIVNVASESLRFAPEGGLVFNVSTMNDPENYETMEDKWMWYGHSKIALSLFTKELNLRLYVDEDIYVNCCHPGLIKSDLFREAGECFPPFFGWVGRRMSSMAERWRRDVPNGALTPLYLATSPAIVEEQIRGEYMVPCQGFVIPEWMNVITNTLLAPVGVYLPPGLRLEPWSTGSTVRPVASDEPEEANDFQLAEKLWEFSKLLCEGGADMMDGKGETMMTKLKDLTLSAGMVGIAAHNILRPTDMSNDTDDDKIIDLRMPLIGNSENALEVDKLADDGFQEMEKEAEV